MRPEARDWDKGCKEPKRAAGGAWTAGTHAWVSGPSLSPADKGCGEPGGRLGVTLGLSLGMVEGLELGMALGSALSETLGAIVGPALGVRIKTGMDDSRRVPHRVKDPITDDVRSILYVNDSNQDGKQ